MPDKLITGLLALMLPLFSLGHADAAEMPRSIEITWQCASVSVDARYPCKPSRQKITFFKDGRLLLQEQGELCRNESKNRRITYDAFVNKNTKGVFICELNDFDFEITYSLRAYMNKNDMGYIIKGVLRQKLRSGERDTGQRLQFNTSVKIDFKINGCYAIRAYRFSESLGRIPRISNKTYNYTSTACSIS